MTHTATENPESGNWIERVAGNRAGTRFFHWIVAAIGVRAAYAMLFFPAWQYVLFDKVSVAALREFRANCGLPVRTIDLFRHFKSFGVSLIDRYVLTGGGTGSEKYQFAYVNEQVIADQVKRGGVVLLGAHMGTWEIAGALLGKRLQKPVHVFMYDDRGSLYAEGSRSDGGVIIHPVQAGGADNAVAIVNALRKGEIVCLHGDRFYRGQRTLPIGFCGKPALFPAGPMAMAMITGASVIPCFTLQTSRFHYEFSAAEPLQPVAHDRSSRELAIRSSMERYVAVLEETCRKFPLQWYNFYPFWKD